MSQYRNITIEQGESWQITLYVTDLEGRPLDLTDYTVTMRMKKHYSAKKYIEFHTEITDAIKGEIKVWLDETETSIIPPLRYVYDCIVNGNVSQINNPTSIITPNEPIVIRFMEGIVSVTPSVSA